MNADLTQISVILSTMAALFGVIWMVFTTRKMNRKLGQYEPIIQDFAALFRYEEDENGAPQIDVRLTKIAEAFSGGIAKSLQMSVMGQLSGNARLEKGLKGAITKDVIDEKMPIINLVGDFMGINTKKYITKHPDAMAQIMRMFGPQIQQFMQGRGNNGGQRGGGGVPEMR